MSFTDIFRNARGLSKPPIDDIDAYWTPLEKVQAGRMLGNSVVGSPDTVRAGIERLLARTEADELMIVSDVFDHVLRKRSYELIAAAARGARIAEPALSR
jgi:alkanesulfonate monooxygenase SsuD/methylene tetrahydromethanopterin reductase-like flavin-dependent oxidoreductase (luciferase family)